MERMSLQVAGGLLGLLGLMLSEPTIGWFVAMAIVHLHAWAGGASWAAPIATCSPVLTRSSAQDSGHLQADQSRGKKRWQSSGVR